MLSRQFSRQSTVPISSAADAGDQDVEALREVLVVPEREDEALHVHVVPRERPLLARHGQEVERLPLDLTKIIIRA